ncbi:MAG: rRNA maturation RNase YbeY [Dehalococcoidia bacterium]|nr:MAG: rRNA maturation RNase YbeY [Dehalococcoidia bacterium]
MPAARYPLDIRVASAQRGQVDLVELRRLVRDVLRDEDQPAGTALALRIAGDAFLRELNLEHRGVDAPTDVLSFPYDEGEAVPVPEGFEDEEGRYLGDIAISLEMAAKQAKAARITIDEEVQHIVLHGVLHLLGYDHETAAEAREMEEREERRLGTHIHGGPKRRGPAHVD